ncbi:FtsX-like permease family protein [Clostridium sp. OS1-26]|jgi:putative ABC transport system permease protein|uniref:ABC transporter permease n=1 Tax=Clostridium sp. OS1-26 TaxID=3070681 RepID=UPI0027E2053D|nr:FtsX-like permease family protein [Clostridium sp. OS1-26]WML37660.1 FtsX-like permease family protein [Clostridium sp. OS1-26]
MNLFNISMKNVKNSLSNYIMYFMSVVFSVFIFFSFKSIQYNKALVNIDKRLIVSINAASIILALFSFMFIYYSNLFFINRRKQEIGTYSLLGMRKKQIARLFIYESFIIGMIAIFLGVSLGFIFTKIITMILVKLMGEILVVKMSLSLKVVCQTLVTFAIIFIVIGIRNNIVIRKKKIIDFFKDETDPLDTKKTSAIKGIIGVILIVISYMIATSQLLFKEIRLSFVILILIIPGTLLFFSSATSLMISLIKRNKVFYYKGRNLIAFSEVSYKISSNSKMLSIIAILIATSVTILGYTVYLYYDIDKNIKENYKFSYNINAENQKVDSEIDNILDKNNYQIKFDRTIELINKKASYKLVNKKDKISTSSEEFIQLIKESDFQSIMKYQNREYSSLKTNNDIYYIKEKTTNLFYETLENKSINLIDENKIFNVSKQYDELLLNKYSTYSLVVVKDSVFNEIKTKENIWKLRAIKIENEEKSLEVSRSIQRLVDENIKFKHPFNFISSIIEKKELTQIYGLFLFIGIFLAIAFLLCTGSIILFKQLSGIYDDKERYIMLKKLGATNKDIKKMLSKQLMIVFICPVIVGTVHNLFAMSIAQKIIQRPIVMPILITLGGYYIGYFIYYFVTLKYANDMIAN